MQQDKDQLGSEQNYSSVWIHENGERGMEADDNFYDGSRRQDHAPSVYQECS